MKRFKAITAVIISALMLLSVCATGIYGAQEASSETGYKNVILFIGDGMGINSIRSAKRVLGIEDEALNMETLPVMGWSKTRSLIRSVTDSAAGGTALACGVRTYDSSIATFIFDPFSVFLCPINLTDVAIQEGKSTGVLTTDSTDGATPATFSAHALTRSMSKEISQDQLASGIDLIWGAKSDEVSQSACAENGFEYVTTETQMNALASGTRSFAQFSYSAFSANTNAGDTPTLEEMTVKAIDLLDDNSKGFFLMVEGAHIDKKSHSNLMNEMTAQLYEFDKAIGAALDYAEADGETLIVITADHETGGITLNEQTGDYYYTKDSHSGVDVPVFVSAEDAGFADGETMKNSDIARKLSKILDTDGKSTLPSVFSPFWELISGIFNKARV